MINNDIMNTVSLGLSYTDKLIKAKALEKLAGYQKLAMIKAPQFEKIAGLPEIAGQLIGGAISTAVIPAAAGGLLGLAYEDLYGDPSHTISDYNKSMSKGILLGLGAGGLYGATKTQFQRVPSKIKAIQDQIDKLTNTDTYSVQKIKKDLNKWEEIAKGTKLKKPMLSKEKLEELLKYHTANKENRIKNLRKQIEVFNNGGFWENARETSGW